MALVAVVSFLLGWGIYEGYWATFPLVLPYGTHPDSPWKIDFIIVNQSRVLGMQNLQVTCYLDSVEYSNYVTVQGFALSHGVSREQQASLGPGEKGIYQCPDWLHVTEGTPVKAHILIGTSYMTWFVPRNPTLTSFTLRHTDAGYEWIEGAELYSSED